MVISISISQLLLRTLLGASINLLMALAAYARRSVSPSGAFTGFMVGFVIFIGGGVLFWLHLGVFFISSTLLGHFKGDKKAQSTAQHEKHDQRDGIQVLSNAGPGAAAAILYLFYPHPALAAAFAASFAAANADTWAGEIGMLSKEPPVSIIHRYRLPTGTSGGVTRLGFYASAAGAAFIALLSSAWFFLSGALHATSAATAFVTAPALLLGALTLGLLVTVSGVLGALIDSILGATVQAGYRCAVTGVTTERPATDNRPNLLIKGSPYITNDTVNFLSVSAASIAAFVLSLFVDIPSFK